MTEDDKKELITALISLGIIAGYVAHRRRKFKQLLRKSGMSINQFQIALAFHQDTLRWMRAEGATLPRAEFHKQLNERLDFADFIANH